MRKNDDIQEPSKTGYQKVGQVITTIIAAAILLVVVAYLLTYMLAPLM